MKKKYKIFLLFTKIVLICLSLNCLAGVKRIGNYRKIKKDINEVACVTGADFLKAVPIKDGSSASWGQEPSDSFNLYARTIMQKHVKRFSRKKFRIHFENISFSELDKKAIKSMLDRLNRCENIETFTVGENILKIFDTLDGNYILLTWQDGYHFTKEYIDSVEAKEALYSLASIASVGMSVVAGGVGMVMYANHDKGFVESDVVLIDKQIPKVLYYTRRISRDNPLADSTMIKHTSQLLQWF